MKFKLLFAFMVLSFVSCIEDDNNSPVTPVVEKKLDKMLSTNYNSNDAIVSTATLTFDDNDRLLSKYIYNASGKLIGQRICTYNENGLLAEMDAHEDGATINTKYKYDNSGRVTESDNMFAVIEGVRTVSTFTYNADNTISVNTNMTSYGPEGEETSTAQYKYFLNAAGQIYRKTNSNGDILAEAVYQGNNIVSFSEGNSEIVFDFNETNQTKGQFHGIVKNWYGDNWQNAILLDGFQAAGLGVSNYVIKQTSSSGILTYNYEFDTEGYPIKVERLNIGTAQPRQVQEVFYK